MNLCTWGLSRLMVTHFATDILVDRRFIHCVDLCFSLFSRCYETTCERLNIKAGHFN